ncbi:MAG: hypothetical protein VYD64_11620 [Pseudomonadota bacterium]|nr:hypothetical protein [Pseudomonadota bacterium]
MRVRPFVIAAGLLSLFNVSDAFGERLNCPVEEFAEFCVFSESSIERMKGKFVEHGWKIEQQRALFENEGRFRAVSADSLVFTVEYQAYSDLLVVNCEYWEGESLFSVASGKLPQCRDAVEQAGKLFEELDEARVSETYQDNGLPSQSAYFRGESREENLTVLINEHKTSQDEDALWFSVMRANRVIFSESPTSSESSNSVPKG